MARNRASKRELDKEINRYKEKTSLSSLKASSSNINQFSHTNTNTTYHNNTHPHHNQNIHHEQKEHHRETTKPTLDLDNLLPSCPFQLHVPTNDNNDTYYTNKHHNYHHKYSKKDSVKQINSSASTELPAVSPSEELLEVEGNVLRHRVNMSELKQRGKEEKTIYSSNNSILLPINIHFPINHKLSNSCSSKTIQAMIENDNFLKDFSMSRSFSSAWLKDRLNPNVKLADTISLSSSLSTIPLNTDVSYAFLPHISNHSISTKNLSDNTHSISALNLPSSSRASLSPITLGKWRSQAKINAIHYDNNTDTTDNNTHHAKKLKKKKIVNSYQRPSISHSHPEINLGEDNYLISEARIRSLVFAPESTLSKSRAKKIRSLRRPLHSRAYDDLLQYTDKRTYGSGLKLHALADLDEDIAQIKKNRGDALLRPQFSEKVEALLVSPAAYEAVVRQEYAHRFGSSSPSLSARSFHLPSSLRLSSKRSTSSGSPSRLSTPNHHDNNNNINSFIASNSSPKSSNDKSSRPNSQPSIASNIPSNQVNDTVNNESDIKSQQNQLAAVAVSSSLPINPTRERTSDRSRSTILNSPQYPLSTRVKAGQNPNLDNVRPFHTVHAKKSSITDNNINTDSNEISEVAIHHQILQELREEELQSASVKEEIIPPLSSDVIQSSKILPIIESDESKPALVESTGDPNLYKGSQAAQGAKSKSNLSLLRGRDTLASRRKTIDTSEVKINESATLPLPSSKSTPLDRPSLERSASLIIDSGKKVYINTPAENHRRTMPDPKLSLFPMDKDNNTPLDPTIINYGESWSNAMIRRGGQLHGGDNTLLRDLEISNRTPWKSNLNAMARHEFAILKFNNDLNQVVDETVYATRLDRTLDHVNASDNLQFISNSETAFQEEVNEQRDKIDDLAEKEAIKLQADWRNELSNYVKVESARIKLEERKKLRQEIQKLRDIEHEDKLLIAREQSTNQAIERERLLVYATKADELIKAKIDNERKVQAEEANKRKKVIELQSTPEGIQHKKETLIAEWNEKRKQARRGILTIRFKRARELVKLNSGLEARFACQLRFNAASLHTSHVIYTPFFSTSTNKRECIFNQEFDFEVNNAALQKVCIIMEVCQTKEINRKKVLEADDPLASPVVSNRFGKASSVSQNLGIPPQYSSTQYAGHSIIHVNKVRDSDGGILCTSYLLEGSKSKYAAIDLDIRLTPTWGQVETEPGYLAKPHSSGNASPKRSGDTTPAIQSVHTNQSNAPTRRGSLVMTGLQRRASIDLQKWVEHASALASLAASPVGSRPVSASKRNASPPNDEYITDVTSPHFRDPYHDVWNRNWRVGPVEFLNETPPDSPHVAKKNVNFEFKQMDINHTNQNDTNTHTVSDAQPNHNPSDSTELSLSSVAETSTNENQPTEQTIPASQESS